MRFFVKTLLLFISLLSNPNSLYADATLVCSKVPAGRRMGDQLATYIKLKWIEHHLGIPLAIQPFSVATNFKFGATEKKFTKASFPGYQIKPIVLRKNYLSDIKHILANNKNKIALLVAPSGLYGNTIRAMKSDKVFIKKIRACLAPTTEIAQHKMPSKDSPNDLIVGLHLRKGSGPDNDIDANKNVKRLGFGHYSVPNILHTKWLPDSYFIEQLEILSAKYANVILHVYIFSDTNNPEQLLLEYKEHCNHLANVKIKNIGLCNQSPNSIMEDFVAIQHCDCLIRSDSDFARVVDLLGRHIMTICPKRTKLTLKAVTYTWDPAIATC